MLSNSERKTLLTSFRYLIYLFVVLFFIILIDKLAHIYHADTFTEFGIVENMQIFLLFLTALTFLWEAFIIKKHRPILIFFFSLCCLAIFRELDSFFDGIFPIIKWKFAFIIPVLGLYNLWKNRQLIRKEFFNFLKSPAFVIMYISILISLPLAQRLGHKPFIQAILGSDNNSILIRRTYEECTECVGYLILLLSTLECYFSFRKEKS